MPSLTGISQIICTQAGKNLLLRGATSDTINDVTFTVNSDGSVTVNGTASANTAFVICNVYLKAGSYILSGAPPTGISTTYEFQVIASNGTTYREYGSGRTFTLAQGTDGLNEVRILIRKNYVANNLVFYPQLELGSTVSAYEPINGTTHTVSLGRTIYGGSVDVVNGTGKDNCTKIKFSNLNWTYYTAGTNPIFYANNVPNIKTYERAEMPNIAIDGYTTRTAHSLSNLSTNMANMECSAIENAQTITFRNDTYTSVNAMLADLGNEYIVYELATGTDFTFTPITPTPETALGVNNFWADEGDSDVTYRADIDLLLGGN